MEYPPVQRTTCLCGGCWAWPPWRPRRYGSWPILKVAAPRVGQQVSLAAWERCRGPIGRRRGQRRRRVAVGLGVHGVLIIDFVFLDSTFAGGQMLAFSCHRLAAHVEGRRTAWSICGLFHRSCIDRWGVGSLGLNTPGPEPGRLAFGLRCARFRAHIARP